MPRRRLAVVLRAASVLALGTALACAHAVEIGEVVVRSYIGQPLVADIELTGFPPEGGVVDARLAHPDVFQGANIGMHPVLSNLRMSVMKRDGRQFLHLTSIAPVQTQYVHLFLELADGSRRSIRAASLPLVADPRPAPPPAVVRASVAAPQPAPVAAPQPAPVAAPAPPLKIVPPAPKRVALMAAAIATAPVPAAACPKPRYSDDEIRACATRDYKNAMLTAQIVELEEKVRALQAALDAPAAVPIPAPARAHTIAHAKAAPPPIRTAAAGKVAAPASGSFPWMWIGAAIAALAAAALATVALLKRRGKPMMAEPAKPKGRLMGRLKDAMQRDTKPGASAGAGEKESGKVDS